MTDEATLYDGNRVMKALQHIEMFAGLGADGKPIAEKLLVRELESGELQLLKSPAFVKGIASGDLIRFVPGQGEFELAQRSGNLSIRIFSCGDTGILANQLTGELEKLGGELDLETPRMLVYSIHVSCGFQSIESILNRVVGKDGESAWLYGNVYDPDDGVTPLNWWQEILQPE
jgi:hypothetical protein